MRSVFCVLLLVVCAVAFAQRKRGSLPFDVEQSRGVEEALSALRDGDRVKLTEALTALAEGRQDVFVRIGREHLGVRLAIQRILNEAKKMRVFVLQLLPDKVKAVFPSSDRVEECFLRLLERGDVSGAGGFALRAREAGYALTPLMEAVAAAIGGPPANKPVTVAAKKTAPEALIKTLRRLMPQPPSSAAVAPPGRLITSIPIKLPYRGGLPLHISSCELPDGTTVFYGGDEVVAVDGNGEVVWRRDVEGGANNAALFCRRIAPVAVGNSVVLPLTDSLLALDGSDGSVLWHSVSIKDAYMLTAPVPVGRRLFSVGVVRKRQDEVVLLCFDGETGKLLWRRGVVSGFAPGGFGAGVYPQLAVCRGRIFVMSGFEWLAAYEMDGEPVWAVRYPLAGFELRGRRVSAMRRRYPLTKSSNSLLVVMPPDSDSVIAFAPFGARRVWQRTVPDVRLAAANRNHLLLIATKDALLLSAKNGAVVAHYELPDEALDVISDDAGFWVLCRWWVVRVEKSFLKPYFVPEARDATSITRWSEGIALLGKNRLFLYGDIGNADKATNAVRSGDPNALLTNHKACLYLIRRLEEGRRFKLLERLGMAVPEVMRAGMFMEAALDAIKAGKRNKAAALLRSSINLGSEGTVVPRLGWVAMPETALFLLASLEGKEDENAARGEAARALGLEAKWRLFLRFPATTVGQREGLLAAQGWLVAGQNWRARRAASLIHSLTKSDPIRKTATSLLARTSSPPIKLFWRTLPCALNAEPPKLRILKTMPPVCVLYSPDLVEVRNLTNGVVLWRLESGADDVAQIAKQTVAVLSGRTLLFVRLKDGVLLRREVLAEGVWSIAGGETLYAASSKGAVLAFDKDGKATSGWQEGKDVLGLAADGVAVLVLRDGVVKFLGRRRTVVRTRVAPLMWQVTDKRLWLLAQNGLRRQLLLIQPDGVVRRWDVNINVGEMAAQKNWCLLLERVPKTTPAVMLYLADGQTKRFSVPEDAGRVEFLKAVGSGKNAGVLWGSDATVRGFVLDVRSGRRVGFRSLLNGASGVAGPTVAGQWMFYAERTFWMVRMEVVDLRSGAVFGTDVRVRGRVWGVAGADGMGIVWTREGMVCGLGCEDAGRVELGRSAAEVLLKGEGFGRYVAALEACGRRSDAANVGVRLLDGGIDEQALRDVTERCLFWEGLEKPPRIRAFKVEKAPAIDGRADDPCWRQAYVVRLHGHKSLCGVENPRIRGWRWLGRMDAEARVWLAWDAKNLYVLIDLDDQIIYPMDQDEEKFHNGDMLYLAIDRRGNGGLEADGDDVLVSLGLVVPRPKKRKEGGRKPRGTYIARQKDDGTGVIYEMAIPWEYFKGDRRPPWVNIPPTGPKKGFTFGLNLVMLDDDTGLGASKTLSLAPGLVIGRQDRFLLWRGFVPGAFAKVVLEEER